MNSNKQPGICSKCGKKSSLTYVLNGEKIYLCKECKKIFDKEIEEKKLDEKMIDKEKAIDEKEKSGKQEIIDEKDNEKLKELIDQCRNVFDVDDIEKTLKNKEDKISFLTNIRKNIREDIDLKYITQYANLLNFNLTPKQIYRDLGKFVVGQKEAKRKLSVAVRRHYKRISLRIKEKWEESDDQPISDIIANNIPKENVLLIGPTGCGKTYICRILSEIVSVPFWSAAMTAFTEDGYVGESVENLLSSLLREAGYYNPLAESGILFLDEIDKKSMKSSGNPSITRDVSGEGVQSAILDMIDTHGAIMNVGLTMGNRRNSQRYTEKFNTRDVLFILGGAFPGLVDIIKRRIGGKKTIGFNSEYKTLLDKQKLDNEFLHQVLPEDIVEYGFLPELVGRIGLISVLDPLNKEEMKDVLLHTENSIIKQQEILAKIEGIDLEFTPEALDAIIDKTLKSNMGIRRLKAIVSNTTEQIFFDLSGHNKIKKVKIIKETIDDPSKYEIV